jgi:hypothetical protein
MSTDCGSAMTTHKGRIKPWSMRFSFARQCCGLYLLLYLTSTAGCNRANPPDLLEPSSDAPAWRSIPFTADFSGPIDDQPDPTLSSKTRAKFALYANHLYVLIESIGPQPSTNFQHNGDSLYLADVVEVYLDPAGDGRTIMELEVSPTNLTSLFLHHWDQIPTYPASDIDVDFFLAHQHCDYPWELPGLKTRTAIKPAPDGQTCWTTTFAIPLASSSAGPHQPLKVNVLRYLWFEQNGQREFNQYNLVPVLKGRPHQSPMAMIEVAAHQ